MFIFVYSQSDSLVELTWLHLSHVYVTRFTSELQAEHLCWRRPVF